MILIVTGIDERTEALNALTCIAAASDLTSPLKRSYSSDVFVPKSFDQEPMVYGQDACASKLEPDVDIPRQVKLKVFSSMLDWKKGAPLMGPTNVDRTKVQSLDG